MIKVGDLVTRNNELLDSIRPFKVLSIYKYEGVDWVSLSNDQISPYPILDKLSNLSRHKPLTAIYGASVHCSEDLNKPLFEGVELDNVYIYIDFTKCACNIPEQKGILHNVVLRNLYIEYKGELPVRH